MKKDQQSALNVVEEVKIKKDQSAVNVVEEVEKLKDDSYQTPDDDVDVDILKKKGHKHNNKGQYNND